MACDGACAELRLLHSPWLPVYIGGFRFLSKSWFGSSEYHVLLTDMKCVWEERMGTAHIQERAQELNRRLRAPVSAELRLLHPEAQMSLRRQEGGNIHLKLKSELGGLPFHWEFHCSPAPVTVVRSTALLRPLFSISVVLQRQVEQLGSLLVQKDKEIQDYRENGATLSRGTVQNTHRTHTECFLRSVPSSVFLRSVHPQCFLRSVHPQICTILRVSSDLLILSVSSDLSILSVSSFLSILTVLPQICS
uniref:Non-homologous end-joining factor 1 n=1 Tax=Sphaeramia orbicularis TaxID=375764 RepID=A0A673AZK5_9TELE